MILRGASCKLLLLVLALLVSDLGRSAGQTYERTVDEERDWREFQEFREWKRLRNDRERDDEPRRETLENQLSSSGDPPPIDQLALMGRYIVNQADWASAATISSRKEIATFPVANVVSVSDGPLGNGTGVPYMYLTPLDLTTQDIARDRRATLLMSLEQGSYCHKKGMDPIDPRCARVLLTGIIKKVTPGTPELEVAKNAVFGRHPWLAHMPPDHHFFFAKLKIASVLVLDTFGGLKNVTVDEYFHPTNPRGRLSNRYRTYPRLRDFRHDIDYLDYEEAKNVYAA